MVIPFVVGMFLAPETPHWYYAQGRDQEGLRSLEWLHGARDRAFLAREVAIIKNTIREKKENKVTLASLLQPNILKPFMIGFIMFVFLNLSGLNIMIFYCNIIFKYSGSSLNHDMASIVVGIILLVSSLLAIFIITK